MGRLPIIGRWNRPGSKARPHGSRQTLLAAGAVIFLIAFCDALVIVGIVVPALPLLFAVGALVGLGHISGPYALLCATLGAFIGDGLSYWVGHRWGPQLRSRWPFSRYPQWLDRGEAMFRRHGSKSIVIARFVGAVRPFVPAIAGMLHMPLRRYALPSLGACLVWSLLFLAPGWVLGKSYDAVAAVADRLALVLGALVLTIGLVWACVLYTWRWFAAHADNLLARALHWTRHHPHLGRYAAALIDPNRPESPSLLMLAVCLLGISWAWFTLLATLLASGGPLALDHSIHEFDVEPAQSARRPPDGGAGQPRRCRRARPGRRGRAGLPAVAQALDGGRALAGGAGVRPGADLVAGSGDRHAAAADRAGRLRLSRRSR